MLLYWTCLLACVSFAQCLQLDVAVNGPKHGHRAQDHRHPGTTDAAPEHLLGFHGAEAAGVRAEALTEEANHALIASALMLSSIALYYGYTLTCVYIDYSRVAKVEGPESPSFKTYVAYRFSYWYVWTTNAMLRVLCIVSVCLWLTGTLVYHITTSSPNSVYSFQRVGYSLMAPDAGLGAESTDAAVILFTASVCGLCIFAVLVAAFQDSFNTYLEALKQGHFPAIERNHILVVGFSASTPALIQTLVEGSTSSARETIVVLAEQVKTEVEQTIKESTAFDRSKAKIVVRSGKGYMTADLKHVSAQACSTIILSPDYNVPKEQRDALVLRSLLVLVAEGWPSEGRIVLVCSLQKNYALFQQIGGHRTSIIMVDSFISDLMVQSSKGLGLGKTITETFTFNDGNELYLVEAPEKLVGRSLFEVSAHFPDAILVGVCNENIREADGCKASVAPDKSRPLRADDSLVMYCETHHTTTAEAGPIARIPPSTGPMSKARSPMRKATAPPETVFVMGWNESIGLNLITLDPLLPSGSQVVTFCDVPVEDRESFLRKVQARWDREFTNIAKFTHVLGALGSRSQLEALPEMKAPAIETATRIFLLWDQSLSPQLADATTVCTILQIRERLEEKGVDVRRVNMVPEVGDVETESFCTKAGIIDFVNVEALRSGIIAMIALEPRLNQVYDSMQSVTFERRGLKYYLPDDHEVPESLTFFEAMCIMRESNDVLLGWSIGGDEHPEDRPQIIESLQTVVENPPKLERKKWVEGRDSLIVLSPMAPGETRRLSLASVASSVGGK